MKMNFDKDFEKFQSSDYPKVLSHNFFTLINKDFDNFMKFDSMRNSISKSNYRQ